MCHTERSEESLAIGPDIVVAAVAEEADADDDVAFKELFLEARAAAQGDDWVFADHRYYIIKRILPSDLQNVSG